MQLRLAVLAPMLATSALLASGTGLAEVALVGCDLLTRGGPRVDYLQFDGSGGSGVAFLRPVDAVGRDCAEVLAAAQSEGFRLRDFHVYGPQLGSGVWVLTTKPGTTARRPSPSGALLGGREAEPSGGTLRTSR